MPQVRAFIQFVSDEDDAVWDVGQFLDDMVYLSSGGLEMRFYGPDAKRRAVAILRHLADRVEALGRGGQL
jgi:hypothetical protein